MAENHINNNRTTNLIDLADRTPEERAEIARKGGIKSGEVRREKKLMSQLYADFLDKDHDIIGKDGLKKKLSGFELMNSVMSKVLSRGDSAAVSLIREIRQGTEGDNIKLTGDSELPISIIIKDAERTNNRSTTETKADIQQST